MNYISIESAIKTHSQIIKESTGRQGVLNENLLQSPLLAIRNDIFYPNLLNKAAFLFFSIIQNHCFVDGNKRTALVLTAEFLALNGVIEDDVDSFVRKNENIAVSIAEGSLTKDDIISIWEVLFDFF